METSTAKSTLHLIILFWLSFPTKKRLESKPHSFVYGKDNVPEIPPLPRVPPEREYQDGANNKNGVPSSPTTFAPKTNGSLLLDTKNVDAVDGIRSPELSPIKPSKADVGSQKNAVEIEVDVKKKRYSTDRAYFIAKEILMTERTYKKDLEVINVWFRNEVKKEVDMPPELDHLFLLIDPICVHQQALLREIELRVTTWEGRGSAALRSEYQRVGDVLLRHFQDVVDLYIRYMDEHASVLERLDLAFHRNKKLEQVYRAFELQKICYLPLSALILKPLQRLLHYQVILDRLLRHHSVQHPDFADCTTAKQILQGLFQVLPEVLKSSENLVQLCELQREMSGFDSLVQPDREFLRQGCLFKHSRKGYQQRMFFLFSDILLYTNRVQSPTLQFKVHGQMPLRGVMVEESEVKMGTNHLFHCFTIYGGTRALTVAGNNQEEKEKWLEDITLAVEAAREKRDDKMQYLSLKSCSSSDEVIDKCGDDAFNKEKTTASPQRSNTTVHVCWHRNTSISMADQLRAVENQLSGFLLRKFKNSSGWQKLWVVFTNFCLFFYKTFQDDSPLASLPLLGYTVTTPSEKDGIQKDFVFKLQFKNHVYFFRAESEYTFGRWMKVIGSATLHTGRTRLFSRKDSSYEG